MKSNKFCNAYVKSHQLPFRELPSSDTFLQINVDAGRLLWHFPFIYFENFGLDKPCTKFQKSRSKTMIGYVISSSSSYAISAMTMASYIAEIASLLCVTVQVSKANLRDMVQHIPFVR